eukprot:NODE_26_length_35450_cov_0.398320.p10 type:complete len:283 gc:universal NODE_26_length_35450_cov_0.398320:28410-29258(+)
MNILISLITAQSCGPNKGSCKKSGCSQWGWCGSTLAHTSGNCLAQFSDAGFCLPLGPTTVTFSGESTDGKCGLTKGKMGCPAGSCCSQWGWCGIGTAWCQSSASNNKPAVTTTPPTAAPSPPVPTTSANSPKLPQTAPFTNCINNKEVALTIDDGPDNTITPKVIDLLTSKGIPATFFQIGVNIQGQPTGVAAIKAALAARPDLFNVASHTWSHLDSILATTDVTGEAQKVNDIMKSTYGIKPRFFRPPFGDWNSPALKIWNDMGMYAISWSVGIYDLCRLK